MKKLIGVALIIVMLALAMCGCGSKPAVEEDDPAQAVELVWYTVGQPPKDLDMVMPEVNKYLKDKLNCTLKLNFVDFGEYDGKLKTLSVANEPMDVVFTASWTYEYRTQAIKGLLYPLDELLPVYGKEMCQIINPLYFEGTKVNGKNYAIPVQGTYACQLGYYFNRKFIDKYNFDFSKYHTMSEMLPLFKEIKRDNPDVIPVQGVGFYEGRDKYDFLIRAGMPGAVRLDDPSCKVINQYEDETFRNLLREVRQVYLAKCTFQDITRTGTDNDFPAGRVACYMSNYHPFDDKMMERKCGFPIQYAPVMSQPVHTSSTVAASLLAISANSKHPVRAMKFLNLLNSDPVLRNMFGYGLEGTHYTKNSDGRIHITDRGAKNWNLTDWAMGIQYILYIPDTEPLDKWQQCKAFDASAKVSPLFGFVFDPTPVEKELAAMTNVVEEYKNLLQNGACDVDKGCADISAKLKAAGLEKYLAEMQKQVDAWKAGKGSK